MIPIHYTFSIATKSDADAVFALYQSLIGTPGCTWNAYYPTIEFVHSDIQLQSLYILKDTQGKIIAAASCGGERELEDFDWNLKNPCELARVAVSSAMHNQGIGSYLLKQVITAVKARGFDGICMLVGIENDAALALYAKFGFERLDAVHMYEHDFYQYRLSL